MKNKALLLEYLIKKDYIVYEKTKIHYITMEEIDEVLDEWSEQKCHTALSYMYDWSDKLYEEANVDGVFCPWCLFYGTRFDSLLSNGCHLCSYGKKHGNCNSVTSRYEIIKNKLYIQYKIDSLCHIPEVQELLKYIFIKYEQMGKTIK